MQISGKLNIRVCESKNNWRKLKASARVTFISDSTNMLYTLCRAATHASMFTALIAAKDSMRGKFDEMISLRVQPIWSVTQDE